MQLIAKWRMAANRVINIIGFGATLLAAGSGLAMALGPGDEKSEEMTGLLGLSGEFWTDLHEPAAAVFTLAVLLHLAFHWRQIRAKCSQYIQKRRLLFNEHSILVLAIVAVLLTAVLATDGPEEEREEEAVREPTSIAQVWYVHYGAGLAVLGVIVVHSARRWSRLRKLR